MPCLFARIVILQQPITLTMQGAQVLGSTTVFLLQGLHVPGRILEEAVELGLRCLLVCQRLRVATALVGSITDSLLIFLLAILLFDVRDLDFFVKVSNVEEKNGKEEYEQTISDAANKRRGDSKALTDKEAAKAELDSFLEDAAGDVKALQKENRGAAKYLSSLHGECDWLLKYYNARKQARADEIDSLNRAKAVLNGADYSFVQKSSTARARKFLRSA